MHLLADHTVYVMTKACEHNNQHDKLKPFRFVGSESVRTAVAMHIEQKVTEDETHQVNHQRGFWSASGLWGNVSELRLGMLRL